MDPIYPWLDPIEVRRMADRLMRIDCAPKASFTDVGFDEGFVGFTPATPATPAAPATPATSATPATPAILSAHEKIAQTPITAAPPRAETLEPPAGVSEPSQLGIKRFRDWMHQEFSATEVFILDGEGEVIFDESGHGRLHFLARSLALESRRPGWSGGHVRLKISADATLEIIPAESAHRRLVLGAVVPQALAAATVVTVMAALTRAATPPTV
jgi:hypothetical protein